MSKVTGKRLEIEDVFLISPSKFGDRRGYFLETYSLARYREIGIAAVFVQDNQSFSATAGTVRGLHFQSPPAAQAKLVRVLRGSIFDVAVDIRRGSPTYGRWCGSVLSAEGAEQIFIPPGFAHGFCTMESDTEVAYKVDAYYSPECESGVLWNDPALGIDWPIDPAVAREIVHATPHEVVVLDKLTYAGNLDNLASVARDSRFRFVRGDIIDTSKMREVVRSFRPDVIMHLAAESHVDRSIDGPAQFIQTNVVSTFSLLQVALEYWRSLTGAARDAFRFHHVSTDEVFGSLGPDGAFTETTPYQPNSPYSASKAASDHLVRAWHHTYGLPVVLSNCSNNYGPYHFPEKLIPLTIINALEGEEIPVYGKGDNVRDWLFVEDHARALILVAKKGRVGESYNIGGCNERRNID